MSAERPDKDIRNEYDFNRGERGKYARRHREGSNVVVLDPDVAKRFKTPDAVNNALRAIVDREQGTQPD